MKRNGNANYLIYIRKFKLKRSMAIAASEANKKSDNQHFLKYHIYNKLKFFVYIHSNSVIFL